MKFGVKNFDDEKFFDYFVGKADFFEVQAIRGNDYSYLQKYVEKGIPIIVHAEHQGFGVNHCDPKKERVNLESIAFSRGLADKVNAEFIIVHPGRIYDKDCSLAYFIKTFQKINDPRIVIENLPQSIDRSFFSPAASPDYIKYILDNLSQKNKVKIIIIFFINLFLYCASLAWSFENLPTSRTFFTFGFVY